MKQITSIKTRTLAHFAALAVALIALAVFLILTILKVERSTAGMFSYPVDDAYIHMQIAKNLAFHQTWGINAGEFGSASSSPLYTVLLSAAFGVFGNHLLLPFILNCVAAVVLLYVAWRWLLSNDLGVVPVCIILLAVVFFTPLPLLVLSGMEHTLQCLFSFLFLFSFAKWLKHREISRMPPVSIFLLAMLTVTIRYEGLFLVGFACIFLFCLRRIKTAFLLGFVAVLPSLVFGIYSVRQGSYFLPNSVLIKSEAAQFSLSGIVHAWGNILLDRLTFSKTGLALLSTQRLLLILPLALIFWRKGPAQTLEMRFLLSSLMFASFFQLVLADTGKFYRYEAYLIFSSVLLLSVCIVKTWRQTLSSLGNLLNKIAAIVLVVFLLLPLVLRTVTANAKLAQACINIYDQQIQMARFLHLHYDSAAVAANDIGAIGYFTQTKVVDLWGLGDIDIARSKKGGYWTAPFLDSISRRKAASIAIIYDSWIGNSIPPSWTKVGDWTIVNNVVCGDDRVSFYAIDPADAEALRRNLRSFQSGLPASVGISYQTAQQ